MKFFIMLSLLSGLVQAAQVKVPLTEKQSFELYHFLQLPEEPLLDRKALGKTGKSVACMRSSAYPGDFEYSCEVTVEVSEFGTVIAD